MHRQQKTFSPTSFILPLAVTALVIFLASGANAQDAEPLPPEVEPVPVVEPVPAPAVELPTNLDDLADPAEVNLAPVNSVSNTNGQTTDTALGVDSTTNADLSASNTTPDLNQDLQANLSIKQTEWADATAKRQELLTLKRAELASSTIERQAALNAETQERMRQLAEKSTAVISGTLTRMKNISSNLREQAENISSHGINTVAATMLLDQIDELINQAESSLAGIDVNIEYTLTSENPREDWADTRMQFQTTTEIIRTIRPLLLEVVGILREAIKNAANVEAV